MLKYMKLGKLYHTKNPEKLSKTKRPVSKSCIYRLIEPIVYIGCILGIWYSLTGSQNPASSSKNMDICHNLVFQQ